MIDETSFKIKFPVRVIDKNKKIIFSNRKFRQDLIKRNMYYFLYSNKKNPFLTKRLGTYERISQKVIQLIKDKYPKKKILNISVFGSSLFSENPGDFDFLAIIEGNEFSLIETEINLGQNKKQPVGISIKGIDNFVYGIKDESSSIQEKFQNQIIFRTVSALSKRHLPIWGYDLVDNKEMFEENIYSQVSDLLNNTYELYYLKNYRKNPGNLERSRKILSRIYEASTYLCLKHKKSELEKIRKRIYFSIHRKNSLKKSKELFDELNSVYQRIK